MASLPPGVPADVAARISELDDELSEGTWTLESLDNKI